MYSSFIFNGKNSLDFGLKIESPPPYIAPKRDISYEQVLGKNGMLVIDNERFEDVEIPYNVSFVDRKIPASFIVKNIKDWLLSDFGVYQLYDTYEPDYFRLASYAGPLNIENILCIAGRGTITFNCKPEMYRITGLETITLLSAGKIINPEQYASRPYFKIWGKGASEMQINNQTIQFLDINEYVELDSDLQLAFKAENSVNNKVVLSEFPMFGQGANTITFTGGISKIECKPRWYTI